MNVIKRKVLQAFWDSPKHRAAQKPMMDWYKIARRAAWWRFDAVKATFGQTDVATDTASGKTATIFDIGGNKYRIVTLIDDQRQTVLITHVMDHKEYDRQKWKDDI